MKTVLQPNQLDTATRRAARWVETIDADLGWPGPAVAFAALRSVLHLLRRTLPPAVSARLSDALPVVARGIFHEPPLDTSGRASLLDRVGSDVRHRVRPEEALRAVGSVLEREMPPPVWRAVTAALPAEIRAVLRVPPHPV